MKDLCEDIDLVKNSGFFDEDWYLKEYKDVSMLKVEPIFHYLSLGEKIRRNPSKLFDVKYYLDSNPDVKNSGMSPLVHYIKYGKKEGRGATHFDSVNRLKLSRSSNGFKVSFLIAETINQYPDLFLLRSELSSASTIVVLWIKDLIDDIEHINQVQSKLGSVSLIVVLHHSANLDLFDSLDILCNIYVVVVPNHVLPMVSLVRMINNNVFYGCQNIVLLNSVNVSSDYSRLLGKVQQFLNSKRKNLALISEHEKNFNGFKNNKAKEMLSTWIHRLHREARFDFKTLPDLDFAVLDAMLVKQIFALGIDPNSLCTLSEEDAKEIMAMLIQFSIAEGSFERSLIDGEFLSNEKRHQQEVKAIAFYLPQFHIIDENDRWWGKGFTEWNNVVRAAPLFRAHYQPRLPADLGFYDLRSQHTQRRQAEIADKYNIHGFCYYYYWFNGQKVLNEPIEQMLSSKEPNFPFCICWANENWSRNWDGQSRHVLLEQSYSEESNRALIQELIRFMKDDRYIRFNGLPVLLVYRIKIIPEWKKIAKMWRMECRKAGLGEIHLCAVRFGLEPLEGQPEDHGVDSFVIFPPHETKTVSSKEKVLDLKKNFNGTIYSYDAVVEGDIKRFEKGYRWPVHRGVMMGWDNTARRMTDARIFTGCTPFRFRTWLKEIVEQEEKFNNNSESLVFINAWNEWAEGTTLEPDQRFGTGYLEAVKSVVSKTPRRGLTSEICNKKIRYIAPPELPPSREYINGTRPFIEGAPSVLVCAHISGHQLFGGERSFLDMLKVLSGMQLNIIVTLPSKNNKLYVEQIKTYACGIYVFPYKQWVYARDEDAGATLQFGDIIATHMIDIVYVNTIVLIEPLVAAKVMGRTSVVHCRELITLDDALRERIGLPVQDIIHSVFSKSDYIIANSKATEKVFFRPGRTFYAPNAVNVDEFPKENVVGKKIKVGIISSNIPKKGIHDFIEVVKLCPQEKFDFLVIGPENELTREYKKQIDAGQLPSNIKFLGYVEPPCIAIGEINVLLNLSNFAESFGRTVAEAMAGRRPVIAYDWGALPELVIHNETGFLTGYRDIPQVVNHLLALSDNPDLISVMGDSGFQHICGNFTHQALKRHLTSAFEHLSKKEKWKLDINKSQLFKGTTIVVPIYNAFESVKVCLETLLKYTQFQEIKVLLINDGSSDERIEMLLAEYATKEGFQTISNERNLGYTKTINKGITEAGCDDIVLLNSDTRLTPCWLEGLKMAAYAEEGIGTVTAMSDNAGAFSFPEANRKNEIPRELSEAEYAVKVIQNTFSSKFISVPTGSGFCMFIKRKLIDQIGLFDDQLFPRGYGEENDFCMRAIDAGWRNVITPWSFVFHERTASFREEKELLVKAGVNAVIKKYPQYPSLVKSAFNSEEIIELRKRYPKC